MPRLLQDIVEETVRRQPDMELVAAMNKVAFHRAVKTQRPDILIIAEGNERGDHEKLLLANPRLKVLVVGSDGRQAYVLELRRTPVVNVSPQGLVDAIRAAAGSEDARA
jgi:hypothetical protein